MKKKIIKSLKLLIPQVLVCTIIITNAATIIVQANEPNTEIGAINTDKQATTNDGDDNSSNTTDPDSSNTTDPDSNNPDTTPIPLPSYIDISNSSELYAKAISSMNNIPQGSLNQSKKAISNGSLKVAFVGDSISEGADLYSSSDNYISKFRTSLKETLPEVDIEVENYSLGARGIIQLSNKNYLAVEEETNFMLDFHRDWSVPGKAWRDHAKDLSPDLLVVAVGMNDAHNRSDSDWDFWNALNNFCSYAETWSKVPDIVLVPTILPTKNSSIYDQRQDVTNNIASVTREYAKEKNYICADANRLFQILRDGKDIVSTYEVKESDLSNVNNFTNGTIEFDLNLKSHGIEGGRDIIYRSSDLGSVILRLQANKDGTGSASLYFNDTPTTTKVVEPDEKIAYEVDKDGNTVVIIKEKEIVEIEPNKTVEISSFALNKSYKVKIEANGISHKVSINDKSVIDYKVYQGIMGGKLSTKDTGKTASSISNLTIKNQVSYTESPLYSEAELLGPYNDPNISGNGINHPNELGHNIVYLPAFNSIIKELKNSYTD